MKNLDTNLLNRLMYNNNILKTEFFQKAYCWYRDLGYEYLKSKKRINFPIFQWYNYFSHPNDNWLLVGGRIDKIENELRFEWIFFVQDKIYKNFGEHNYWRYLFLNTDYTCYLSKIKEEQDIPENTIVLDYKTYKEEPWSFPKELTF